MEYVRGGPIVGGIRVENHLLLQGHRGVFQIGFPGFRVFQPVPASTSLSSRTEGDWGLLEGFVVAYVWVDPGNCEAEIEAVHVRVFYTTWNPMHEWPNWCDELRARQK